MPGTFSVFVEKFIKLRPVLMECSTFKNSFVQVLYILKYWTKNCEFCFYHKFEFCVGIF